MNKMKSAVAKMATVMKSTLSPDAADLAAALSEVVAAADAEEEEVDADALADRLSTTIAEKVAKDIADNPEAITPAVSKVVRALGRQPAAPASSFISSRDAADKFAAVVREARDGRDFSERWRGVLSSNGITGIEYPTQVASVVQTKWESAAGLFAALPKVASRQFTILATQADDANTYAHGHVAGQTKKEQTFALTNKKLALQMIYKWLPVNRLDLQALDAPTAFVEWVAGELASRLAYTIERAIIAGDSQSGNDAITSFEGIGKKTASDAYTTVVSTATAQTLIKDLLTTVVNLDTKGNAPWLFINRADLAAALTAPYNETGLVIGGVSDLAARLGVERIVPVNYLPGSISGNKQGAAAVFITPALYYRIGGDIFGETWTIHEKNQEGYMAEIAAGGGIAGLGSTAVIRKNAS